MNAYWTTYKDTDLREALRRKYANTPLLPSDFMSRMHQASRPKKNYLILRRWLYPISIAAVLVLAVLIWPKQQEGSATQEVVPEVAETESQPVPQPIVEEKKDEVLSEVQPAPQPVKQSPRLHKQSPLFLLGPLPSLRFTPSLTTKQESVAWKLGMKTLIQK